MSIPNPLDAQATCEALDYFAAAGFNDVDTAIMYQGGKSESTLGELHPHADGYLCAVHMHAERRNGDLFVSGAFFVPRRAKGNIFRR